MYRVVFARPLESGGAATLEFNYVFRGRNLDIPFPIARDTAEELYLISDFKWLPTIYLPPKIGQFYDIYRPTWTLKVKYPSAYVSVTDGTLTDRTLQGDNHIDVWESVIGGYPHLFIAPYDLAKSERGPYRIEIYTPRDDELTTKARLLLEDIGRVLEVYTSMFNHPGSNTYRVVATHTNGGGHGQFMGQALYLDFPDVWNFIWEKVFDGEQSESS